MTQRYAEFHRRSIEDREGFWREQARLIDWEQPFDRVLDYSRPPFARWFVGGLTNLCHNAVDRHLALRSDQKALIWISTEVDKTESFTYRQLHDQVNVVAAMMRSLGVKRGDRVIIYMPNMPEAVCRVLRKSTRVWIHPAARRRGINAAATTGRIFAGTPDRASSARGLPSARKT